MSPRKTLRTDEVRDETETSSPHKKLPANEAFVSWFVNEDVVRDLPESGFSDSELCKVEGLNEFLVVCQKLPRTFTLFGGSEVAAGALFSDSVRS